MRFHVALADAITRGSGGPSSNLSAAPREALGVSLAEFETLAGEYRVILRGAGIGASNLSAPPESDHSAQVTSGFAAALRKISDGGAAKLKEYMNGPFRASMRTRSVLGGTQ